MDHDALRLFLHLARTLHYGRTSRECHVSPSTLTRAVQRLEEQVGTMLLERSPRSVRLTPAGARFVAYAGESLERWQAFRRETEDPAAALRGSLSVFCTATACHSILPRILAGFREANPGVKLQLETGHAADALDMLARVDLTIAAVPDRLPRGLVSQVLTTIPLRFVAPADAGSVSRMVERKPIPWEDVPMIRPQSGLARHAMDAWFRRQRKSPTVYGEVVGSEATLALVSLGCGVGILPELVVERSPLRASVRIVETNPGPGAFTVALCTRQKRLTDPILRAFWNWSMAAG